MRRARSLPPPRRRLSRTAALLGLVLSGWGCQQPPTFFYYGYGSPGCVPVVPAPTAPVKGGTGEPTTEVIQGGMTSGDTPGRTTTVMGGEKSTRVVVSEPATTATPGSWRRKTDSQTTLATSVEGGVRTSGDSAIDSSVDR